MKENILGVAFDKLTRTDALKQVMAYLETDENHIVATPNPEIIMAAHEDDELNTILSQADLVLADGIGVIIGSKILKKTLTERVEGCDLVTNVLASIADQHHTAYFLGAKPGIAEEAKMNMMNTYPGLKIVGTHDGYFDAQEEKVIVEELIQLKPDIILVGFGSPRQEQFMYRYKNTLNTKVMVGVGGSLDILAGHLKRAPKLYRKLGMEWLYRLFLEPSRIKRMSVIPIFILKCMKERYKK